MESAVRRYVEASAERDPVKRRAMLEVCLAPQCRFVTRSGVLLGPSEIDAMIARFHADPENLGFRMTSVIDARGTTFRYRTLVERRSGPSLEVFDAGEIDESGRIVTFLVFAGPLADAPRDS